MDMEGSSLYLSSSFLPPIALSRYPSWVLLDERVYFANHEIATAKKVKTSTGEEVQISFCLVDPPAVSQCCVHCPQIRSEDILEARVVSSAENLVLLCFAFKADLVEFFVCKAGSGGNLSIEPVPYSPTGTRHSWHAAIVPRDEDGSNFLLADLSPRGGDRGHYDLHVYSSETSKWTTTYLQLPTPAGALPRDLPSLHDKVISLGGSLVGWVDLWRGIVFCDVLDKEPVLTFIPLPTTAFDLHRTGQARKVRDVAFCNGSISFVEVELCLRERSIVSTESFKTIQSLDTQYFIPLKACLAHDDDLDKKPRIVPDGWKIRTMFRDVSWDYWKKRHTVHVDDMSVPKHTVLLDQVANAETMKYTLRNLKTIGYPFFGVHGDNVVYLTSDDEDSWIIGVDLEKKKLEVIPYFGESSSRPTILPCAFPKYMNATPRLYAELVAAGFSQKCVLNNHPPMDGTAPVASSAQTGVLNCHLPLRDTDPDNLQPQQNTPNVHGHYGTSNGSGHGAHSGYDNYQQPTPLQPEYVLPPNWPPIVQPTPSLTQSGYIYAHWTVPDSNGRVQISVPLNGMNKPILAPLVLSTPPVPWPQN